MERRECRARRRRESGDMAIAAGLGLAFGSAPQAWGQDTSSWFGGSVTGQTFAVGLQGAGAGGMALPDGWSWGSATAPYFVSEVHPTLVRARALAGGY